MEVAGAAFPITPLLSTCTKVVTILHNVGKKFKRAPLMMTSIATECSLIHVALAQLRSFDWAAIAAHTDGRQEQLTRATESIILGCTLSLSVIEEYAVELQEYVDGSPMSPTEQMGIMARVRVLWKEDEMRELLLQLRGYQTGLTSLIRAAHDVDFTDSQDLLTGPSSNYTLLLQRSRSSRARKPLSIHTVMQQAATYSNISRSPSKVSHSATPSGGTASIKQSATPPAASAIITTPTIGNVEEHSSSQEDGEIRHATKHAESYDGGATGPAGKKAVTEATRRKRPAFLSLQTEDSQSVVDGETLHIKKSIDQMRKSSPTVGDKFRFVPGEPPVEPLPTTKRDLVVTPDEIAEEQSRSEQTNEAQRTTNKSRVIQPPTTSPPQIPLPDPPSRSPSRSRSGSISSLANPTQRITRRSDLLNAGVFDRRQASSPLKRSPLLDSVSQQGGSPLTDDDMEKATSPPTPHTDVSIPLTPSSESQQPHKQLSSSSVRDQIMVLPETARLRKQASNDRLRNNPSIEMLSQNSFDEPMPSLPESKRDHRPVVGNAFGRQGAQSAQVYRTVVRSTSSDMLSETSKKRAETDAQNISTESPQASRAGSDARRPPTVQLPNQSGAVDKAHFSSSAVSPTSVASSPRQATSGSSESESWPLGAPESFSHQTTYYRSHLQPHQNLHNYGSNDLTNSSRSLTPELTPRASLHSSTPRQRSRSNTQDIIEDSSSSINGSAAPSILSDQWHRPPRERLLLGPRMSRADETPWELGESSEDYRLEQIKARFPPKPRLGNVLGISRSRDEYEAHSPPRSPLLTDGFLTNVKAGLPRDKPDDMQDHVSTNTAVQAPSSTRSHQESEHSSNTSGKKDKKEKKKKESRFGGLGAIYKEYKIAHAETFGNSLYATIAEEQRREAETRDNRPATGSTSTHSGNTRPHGSIDTTNSSSNKTSKALSPRPSGERGASVSSESASSRKSKKEKPPKKSGGFLSMREMWKEYSANARTYHGVYTREEAVPDRNIATPAPWSA